MLLQIKQFFWKIIFNRISYNKGLWEIRGQIPLLEKFIYKKCKDYKSMAVLLPSCIYYKISTKQNNWRSFQEFISMGLNPYLTRKKLNSVSFKTT